MKLMVQYDKAIEVPAWCEAKTEKAVREAELADIAAHLVTLSDKEMDQLMSMAHAMKFPPYQPTQENAGKEGPIDGSSEAT